jgi:hypothetical protein
MQVRTTIAPIFVSLAVVLAALLAAPGSASAQAGPPPGVRLDVHGDFGWYHSAGAGMRVDIPIVREGFIRSANVSDDLSISPGLDLFSMYGNGYHGIGLMPIVMVQWNIYFARQFSVFAELGLVLLFGPNDWRQGTFDSYIGPAFQLGFRWHFSDAVALLLRGGWPTGGQIGLAFDL